MDTAHSLDALHHVLPEANRLIPEMAGDLAPLLQALQRAQALALSADRRLFSLDLPNLVQTLDRIAKMRAQGIESPALDQAAQDASLLARDMQRRAHAALAQEAEDIAIHSAVAAHKASGEPLDVTPTLRLLAAAPTPSNTDRPGVLVATSAFAQAENPHPYGRISGEVFAFCLPHPRKSAGMGAAILPAGHIATFAPKETFFAYTTGHVFGDRFQAPDTQDCVRTFLVEAGPTGATVHGPAILSLCPQHREILSLAKPLSQARKDWKENYLPWSFYLFTPVFAGFVGGITFIMAQFIENIAEKIISTPANGDLGPVLFAVSATLTAALCLASIWQQRSRLKRLTSRLPGILTKGNITTRLADFARTYALPSKRVFKPLAHLEGVHMSVPDSIMTGKGWNIALPEAIEAEDGRDVRVMRPLPALPAPIDTPTIVPRHAKA